MSVGCFANCKLDKLELPKLKSIDELYNDEFYNINLPLIKKFIIKEVIVSFKVFDLPSN